MVLAAADESARRRKTEGLLAAIFPVIIVTASWSCLDSDCMRCCLPCKYHAFCIDEWLARSVARNCPSCLHCIDNVSSQEDDIELISL